MARLESQIPMETEQEALPSHLGPSELGTKEYWEDHYTSAIRGHTFDDGVLPDPIDLDTWFDDVDAPNKIVDFVTSETFPLSPNHVPGNGASADGDGIPGTSLASVLDLGTGNGSMLFTLRLQARYYGDMVGVDYSQQSVELARRLGTLYGDPAQFELSDEYDVPPAEHGCDKIQFEQFDVITEDARSQAWWPGGKGDGGGGFDLVLDKGTFDAISLSADTLSSSSTTSPPTRIHTVYPARVIQMVKLGGFLLITSCNWTEAEVVRWFTTGTDVEGRLKVWRRLEYPVFEFGGQKGQGVASVCFRRIK